MQDLSFKFASESDFDFILEGMVEIAKIEKFVIPDMENYKTRIRSAIKDKHIRVAAIGGDSVGFIWFTISRQTPFGVDYGPFDREYAFVDFVFVRSDFRKRQIGTQLYSDLGEYCKKKGVCELICDVLEVNKGSKKFHKELGFKPFVSLYSKKLK